MLAFNPSIVTGLAVALLVTAGSPVATAITWYSVIALPPVVAGACHVTSADWVPAVAVTDCGAEGRCNVAGSHAMSAIIAVTTGPGPTAAAPLPNTGAINQSLPVTG